MSLRALYDLPAPAKLNAFLHLVGRRPDGYHLLESVFVLLDWADTLHVDVRDDGRLQRHDLGLPLPADDLCLRAARSLQEASGCTLGVDISIHKRIPWGAGLGGGSSDAATCLLALNRLWRLHWPRSQLLALALKLGADVPFFLAGRNALVSGIGEKMQAIDWPEGQYAVLKPEANLPTPSVFAHPARVIDPAAAILTGSLADVQIDVAGLVDGWFEGAGTNHLQPAAEDLCPEVAQAALMLQGRYGNSRMTGSGSAVFARMQAKSGTVGTPMATSPAETLPPGWVSQVCRSLPVHPLVDWAG